MVLQLPSIVLLIRYLLVGMCAYTSLRYASPCQASIISSDPGLEAALSSLFTNELGYTLIGEKPVSIQEGTTSYLRDHPEVAKRLFPFLIKAFKESSGFILKISGDWNQSCDIELFNIRALKKEILKHPELRTFIRKKFRNTASFLRHLRQTEESVFEVFDHRAFLLGLIFGYGRDNANYYCRLNEVSKSLRKYPHSSILSDCLKPNACASHSLSFFSLVCPREGQKTPITEKTFDSLEAEWEWIQQVQWDLSEISRPTPPFYIHLPFYICRHGNDSERTRNRYIEARDRLAHLFCNRPISKVIIEIASPSE